MRIPIRKIKGNICKKINENISKYEKMHEILFAKILKMKIYNNNNMKYKYIYCCLRQ